MSGRPGRGVDSWPRDRSQRAAGQGGESRWSRNRERRQDSAGESRCMGDWGSSWGEPECGGTQESLGPTREVSIDGQVRCRAGRQGLNFFEVALKIALSSADYFHQQLRGQGAREDFYFFTQNAPPDLNDNHNNFGCNLLGINAIP